MQRSRSLLLLLAAFGLLMHSSARADKSLEGIACRSVHLGYKAAEGTAFYNEVSVERSAPGTYFMACGFRRGYFGMQELADGKKVVLFSVWDAGRQNDPKAAPKDRRVKVLFQGKDVHVRRFGGEGTGGQSFFNYDWKIGETCRFLVRAKPSGDRTAFAGYFYLSKEKRWKHLVTFSTLAGGQLLHGYYSFVEDFRRNRVSTTIVRRANFGVAWVRRKDDKWQPLTQARFTADSNPVTNVNAGVKEDRFFLATGGETQNKDAALRSTLRLPQRKRTLPVGLPTDFDLRGEKGERQDQERR